jgi:hypothetical protein
VVKEEMEAAGRMYLKDLPWHFRSYDSQIIGKSKNKQNEGENDA